MISHLSSVTSDEVLASETVWFLTGSVGEGESVRRIPINAAPFQIGRRADVNLCLRSPMVSKVHAEIVVANGAIFVRDLASTNGTFVNGRRVEKDTPIGEGDVVQFSELVFRVGREDGGDSCRTVAARSTDWTSTLSQFNKLISQRAVIPFFQPIIDFADEQVIGYEVLARSDLDCLRNPREMFFTAMRLNLEAELSTVCREIGVEVGRRLPGSASLFLNTHPVEKLNTEVMHSLHRLRESAPEQPLTVEIHEGAVTDLKQMKSFRDGLKDLDIGLAYDDFGAGQARLLDLVAVPPDYLKFDLGLIRGIHQASNQHQQMVATLVRMVRDFGVAPLAEGIECHAEAEICFELGFAFAQGFYYGKPAPIDRYL